MNLALRIALVALVAAMTAPAIAKVTKKQRAQIEKCEPPKRWVEYPALADDAGNPARKRVCK